MTYRVAIIGADMGALTAAIRLTQRGCQVTVFEARNQAGGLAANVVFDGFRFDAGPYVLLDRCGLEWAFLKLKLNLNDDIRLNRIPIVYEVRRDDSSAIVFFDSLDRTVEAIDSRWPGSGVRYRSFIRRMELKYARLQSLQCLSRPGITQLIRSGAWRDVPFLLKSLQRILASTHLPDAVIDAIGIWTHVAGQTIASAPAPLALVPAAIHKLGAYYPAGGIGTIPAVLYRIAKESGVQFEFYTRVERIRCDRNAAVGVETAGSKFWPADAVISNAGLGTYINFLDDDSESAIPVTARDELQNLPLQSPGVCAYLAVKGDVRPPYLKFRLLNEPDGCRLLVTPSIVEPNLSQDGWVPARLIAPMDHTRAASGGDSVQRAFLEKVLAEDWWRNEFSDIRLLSTRIPLQWESDFLLYRQSMNPVMTARFMRAGRLAHRSPWINGLYLAGSATHPGQWVSFCAVSGILSADMLLQDLGTTC